MIEVEVVGFEFTGELIKQAIIKHLRYAPHALRNSIGDIQIKEKDENGQPKVIFSNVRGDQELNLMETMRDHLEVLGGVLKVALLKNEWTPDRPVCPECYKVTFIFEGKPIVMNP